MTTTAWVILVGFSVTSIVGVAAGLFVFRSTRVGFQAEPTSPGVLAQRETVWAVAVGLFLVTLLALTIFQVPYFFATNPKGKQKLELTGQQFAWTINPPRVKAGLTTLVEVHATDVSHAAGIYNPNGDLIKQVNVLPGVTQDFTIKFKRPGTYKIRCLEFCGLDHHKMRSDLVVTR